MKKILFVIPEYSHGGTNKSLENLLSLIDKKKYKISIYCLYEDGGEYYKKVFEPYIVKKSRLYYWLHDNVYTRKVMGVYNKLSKRDNFTWLYKRETKQILRNDNFDIVIGYQEGITTLFVSYFHNTKKIAWTHGIDFQRRKNEINEDIIYQQGEFNQIVCVSDCAAEIFKSVYPEFSRVTTSIHNTLNIDNIVRLSNECCKWDNYDSNCFTILSVGRFNWVKQFEKIPELAKKIQLNNSEIKYRWFIMGAGCQTLEMTKEEIINQKVENFVYILSPQNNPYPFIKKADILVCTSQMESFSYVIAEAKILHTPVLSTDFPVAYEVIDRDCGWICSLEEMPVMLTDIITNKNGKYSKIKEKISKKTYGNEEILRKFDQMIQTI